MASRPTLVLDTNAWLDLLVFADPMTAGIDAQVAAGDIRLAIDDRALAELARVLRYPVLALDAATADRAFDRARGLATCVDATGAPPLPRCRDPDDQPFLEIAVVAGASALLTRDDALLRLSRRMKREFGVAIVPPAAWRDAVAQMSNR